MGRPRRVAPTSVMASTEPAQGVARTSVMAPPVVASEQPENRASGSIGRPVLWAGQTPVRCAVQPHGCGGIRSWCRPPSVVCSVHVAIRASPASKGAEVGMGSGRDGPPPRVWGKRPLERRGVPPPLTVWTSCRSIHGQDSQGPAPILPDCRRRIGGCGTIGRRCGRYVRSSCAATIGQENVASCPPPRL